MVNFTILAGGYSSFIATYIFDLNSSSLLLTQQNPTGVNPSWIASHPQNSSILYAVNEDTVGAIQSFIVDNSGGLTLVDKVSSGGNGPPFTNPLSTGEVTAMNFGSADCSLVATVPNDPLHFQTDSPVVEFSTNGSPSNPHMSLEHNGEVLVADLGADKVWRLVRDGPPGNFKIQGQIDVAPGNGPRHMAILDGILFIVNELTSTLTAQQIPAAPNGTTLPLIANVSIIPSDDANINGTFRGAELLISTPSELFPNPLIYVSNRNLGPGLDPRGDSIAIFEFNNATETPNSVNNNTSSTLLSRFGNVVNKLVGRRLHTRDFGNKKEYDMESRDTTTGSGALTLQTQVFTGLQQIRSMAIGPVDGGGDMFLIAGAFVGGGVVMFNRTNGGRNLTEVARNQDLANRTSFVFV